MALDTTFTTIGSDDGLLIRGAEALRAGFPAGRRWKRVKVARARRTLAVPRCVAVSRGEATFGRRKVLDRHVRGPLSPLRAHVGPW